MKKAPLLIGFAVGTILTTFFLIFFPLRFGYGGYYLNGKIWLIPAKYDTYEEYRFASDHEYGHYVYETKFEKGDLKLWKATVDACKLQGLQWEGNNAQFYRSMGVKYEEEFADSYAQNRQDLREGSGHSLCSLKVAFLNKFT
jgi:hypothetical protein